MGIDPLKPLAAHVVIAIARGGGKAGRVHPVFLHGADDLALVELGHGVELRKAGGHGFEHRLAECIDLAAYAVFTIHLQKLHLRLPPVVQA